MNRFRPIALALLVLAVATPGCLPPKAPGTRTWNLVPDNREPTYLEEYLARVQELVNRNWAFPAKLAGGKRNLEAMLVVVIERNGDIKKMWFEKRSGNADFNESARRAVTRSNPVPPLPEEYAQSSLTVGLVFRPPR